MEDAYSLSWVEHGFCPCFALIAGTTNNFSPAKLIFTCLSTLITHSWPVEHLVEGQLLHQLRPSIRGGFELLNILFAIPFVVQNLPITHGTQLWQNAKDGIQHTSMSCLSTSSSKDFSACLIYSCVLLSKVNVSSFGASRLLPVSCVRAGPKSIFPAANDASINSFRRRVGVPSMHECSPRKPDLPFSNTMTEKVINNSKEEAKQETTYVGAYRRSGSCHHRPNSSNLQLPE